MKLVQSLMKSERCYFKFGMFIFFNHTSYLWFSLGFVLADLVHLNSNYQNFFCYPGLISCSPSDIKLLMPWQSCVSFMCSIVSEAPQFQVPHITVLQRPLLINICPFVILVFCLCQSCWWHKTILGFFLVFETFDSVTERKKLQRIIAWN